MGADVNLVKKRRLMGELCQAAVQTLIMSTKNEKVVCGFSCIRLGFDHALVRGSSAAQILRKRGLNVKKQSKYLLNV